MIEQATENTFGSWSTPELPLLVEYPLEVIDEVRAVATDGLQRLRGGLEVGGVLFGVRRESGIRILTWRPISCEHALGPTLQLSTRDREALRQLLADAASDSDLTGLQPAGWFVSHTRSEVSLSASDLKVFDEFFSEPWHVTLVLHPTQAGPARAGFFARDSEGGLKSDSSYQEFVIKPMHRAAALRDVAAATPEKRAAPGPVARAAAQGPAAVVPRAVEPPRFRTLDRRTAHRRWLWMLPVILGLIVAGLFVRQRFLVGEQVFTFQVYDSAGTLEMVWDVNATPVRNSHLGVIDIQDGNESTRISLSDDELHQGRRNYARRSGDVELRMAVYPVGSTAVQQFVRFIDPGTPAVDQKK